MPTGYTADVANGKLTTLREFALQCARGMGALIMMRDDPWDAPIPEKFEPSSYHTEALAKAKARFDDLEAMTSEQREAAANIGNAEVEKMRADAVARNTETLNRYNAMLAQVIPWKGAPEGLKEFMLEQLHTARDFDVSSDPLRYYPTVRSTEDWYAQQLAEALRGVEYHSAELAKEVERTDARNAWLAQLRASLPSASRSPES